ncbi:hypothetical protein CYMTET_17704 [Cymbomonas tetramitiformis]|uniref:Gfo/Idh/MocA-like oxidoreductase N-terminal domain-containing protein n=1 Tax=Cymbomonas tetramitiformis TaxID=36881 RepID=A0AAE0L6N7_9CHLO|nr:hypothetical protein CYMTET_17704 [Cymbomonas tetramitiformis]
MDTCSSSHSLDLQLQGTQPGTLVLLLEASWELKVPQSESKISADLTLIENHDFSSPQGTPATTPVSTPRTPSENFAPDPTNDVAFPGITLDDKPEPDTLTGPDGIPSCVTAPNSGILETGESIAPSEKRDKTSAAPDSEVLQHIQEGADAKKAMPVQSQAAESLGAKAEAVELSPPRNVLPMPNTPQTPDPTIHQTGIVHTKEADNGSSTESVSGADELRSHVIDEADLSEQAQFTPNPRSAVSEQAQVTPNPRSAVSGQAQVTPNPGSAVSEQAQVTPNPRSAVSPHVTTNQTVKPGSSGEVSESVVEQQVFAEMSTSSKLPAVNLATFSTEQPSSGPLAHLNRVRVGFIGAGDISNLHAAGVRKSSHARLVGLWNRPNCPIVPDPQAKAQEYGCLLYESAEALVSSPDIDVVYILTNMQSHLQYATMAMKAGKHVLCEKPVGASVKEIEEMAAIAKANKVLCVPGHNYIHEPQLDRMKDLIDQGALGEITQLYIMYNIYHPEDVCARLPGIIRQILTHHGYITLFLLGDKLGDPVTVSAMKATINNGSWPLENVAHVTMQFRSGALGHMQASFANDDHTSSPWSFTVKVMGTKGACNYNYNDCVVNQKHIVHSHTYCAYPYAVEAQSEYFTNQILLEGRPVKSSMANAVTCQKIIEASELSILKRRHVDLTEIMG